MSSLLIPFSSFLFPSFSAALRQCFILALLDTSLGVFGGRSALLFVLVLFIQSQRLGTDVYMTHGVYFWRAFANDIYIYTRPIVFV